MEKQSVFTKSELDDILKQANSFWDTSSQDMSPFFENVNEMERLTRMLLPEEMETEYDKYPDRSCLVPPDIFNNFNATKSLIRKMIFAKKPWQRVTVMGKPFTRNELTRKVEILLQAIYDKMRDGQGFESVTRDIVDQVAYSGTTVGILKWSQEVSRKAQRDGAGSLVLDNGRPIFKEVVNSEFPELVPCDIRRVRVERAANNWDNARLVGYHALVPRADLIKLNSDPKHFYDFDAGKLEKSTFQRDKYYEYAKDETATYTEKAMPNNTFGDQMVELRDIRGYFRFKRPDGSGFDVRDLIVHVGNGMILGVKYNDLPLHGWEMFVFPQWDPKKDRMFPMGSVEPVRDLFVEMVTKRNQSLDSANRRVYSTYIGDAAACEGLPEYIPSSNDQILKVDLMAANCRSWQDVFGTVSQPELGQDTFSHAQVLGREIKYTMRQNEYMGGQVPDTPESATGVMKITSGGEDLTADIIRNLTDTFFQPVARRLLVLYNFFNGGKPQTIQDRDGRDVVINPGDLDYSFNVTIETNLATNNPAAARRYIEAFPVIKDDPFYDPIEVRETLNEILDLPNKDRLLLSDEYQDLLVDRESIMLAYGHESPVHPLDPHMRHIENHMEMIQWIVEQPDEVQRGEGLSISMLQNHIADHQAFMEQQNNALGNTKELGGNSGNLVQPMARAGNTTRAGAPTGTYMPSQGRR